MATAMLTCLSPVVLFALLEYGERERETKRLYSPLLNDWLTDYGRPLINLSSLSGTDYGKLCGHHSTHTPLPQIMQGPAYTHTHKGSLGSSGANKQASVVSKRLCLLLIVCLACLSIAHTHTHSRTLCVTHCANDSQNDRISFGKKVIKMSTILHTVLCRGHTCYIRVL